MAASEANLQYMQKLMGVQMISYDKVNQLRQVLYLRDKEHTLEIMAEHGRILKPKFQMVLDTLGGSWRPGSWDIGSGPRAATSSPYYAPAGTAKRTLELCKEAGVVMTAAGATYPYGVDPP